MTETIKRIGEYKGAIVYQDLEGRESIVRMRGPIKEHKDLNNFGTMYWNHKTNTVNLPNGDIPVFQKVEYETKGYIVGTDNIDEAIILIEKYVNK